MIDILADALVIALAPQVLLAVLLGVMLGVTVGAIPGISGDMAMAVLLPFVFTMDAAPAIGMLMGIYKGGLFGGSISAIMFGVPGTPGAAATVIDGYPAKLAGAPNRALHTALYASAFGDLFGVSLLIFVAAPLAVVALSFGPRDFFALYVVSIVVIAVLDKGKVARGFAAAAIGVLISMIGRDPFTGAQRLTFGLPELSGGVGLVPLLIGLFALSEIFVQIGRVRADRGAADRAAAADAPDGYDPAGDRLGWREWLGQWRALGVGSATGAFIGALPGAGATLAGFLGYGLAQRVARRPDLFGKGSLEGVAAPESANSATAGATLIPLFAFGIPGSGSAALIGAAFVMQGISPGPNMIEANLVVIYAVFVLLLFGTACNLGVSKLLLPFYARVSMIEPRFVLPVVVALAIMGTYATSNSVTDVWMLIAAGVFGVVLRGAGVPIPPLALGFILGPGMERALRQSLLLGRNDPAYLLESPLAVGIYIAGAGVIALFVWATRRG